ncbi:MAG TPA: alpha-L-fucosidase, partial [Anaerolineaceae bacterium]|nr:alpha-L-fucosidase [Anaerolineaceae bacterium]
PQVSELLSHYGEISMLWFDTPMGMTLKQSQKLVALVKSLQADCLINGRIGHGLGDYLSMADNRIPRGAIKSAWEVPVTLNQSWGYKASDEAWTSPAELIKKWLKIISRGGNILLNVGPRGDGSLPEASTTILDTIGAFLTRNAEAFYHTLPTPEYVFELDGVYFTHKPGLLYITVLEPKKWTGKWLSLYHMRSIATQASFLASGDTLELRVGKDLEGFGHWAIRLPETLYAEDKLGWVIKVTLESENFEVEALE